MGEVTRLEILKAVAVEIESTFRKYRLTPTDICTVLLAVQKNATLHSNVDICEVSNLYQETKQREETETPQSCGADTKQAVQRRKLRGLN